MEKTKKEILIGNSTTILTTIFLSIAGLLIGILGAYGIKLPIDQQSLAGVIGLIVMFLFSIVNAKFHNTYFDEDGNLTINVENLTDNQISAIQNFIDNCTAKNTVDDSTENIMEDIDPASEYEEGGC